jgi:excisionase family DNA binding protein
MKKDILTTNEAASLLGFARTSLINWVEKGELESSVTPGGHRRFKRTDLIQFATTHGFVVKGENPASAQESAEASSYRVLLVDDDDDFRQFANESLDIAGDFEVKEATNGIDAALITGSWKPNVILLDLHMPKMDGYQFISQIRANSDFADIKIIVLTAYADAETREKIGMDQVNDLITKPIGIKDFVSKLRALTK